MSYTECERLDGLIKDIFFECADRDAELFGTIDTSGIVTAQRLEKRILRLIKLRTRAGVNRFCYKRRRA